MDALEILTTGAMRAAIRIMRESPGDMAKPVEEVARAHGEYADDAVLASLRRQLKARYGEIMDEWRDLVAMHPPEAMAREYLNAQAWELAVAAVRDAADPRERRFRKVERLQQRADEAWARAFALTGKAERA